MSLVLEFLPEAQAEVECVTGDYEARVHGLGVRFRTEVERESVCSDRPASDPLAGTARWPSSRQSTRLSYYIAFVIREECLLITAVAHTSRHPDYWMSRIP